MASSSDASAGPNNIRRPQLPNPTSYDGDFQSQRDQWLGNTFNAAGDVHIHQDVQTDRLQQAQHQRTRMSSNVYISGQARVHLGDNYAASQHLFEVGTEEEKRAALLNFLYYDGLDMKREQLSSSDVDPRSFSWVEDSGFPQWLSMDSTPFWINGKPGSGKSTLMKYLSESNSTLKRLPSEGQGWAIVHLFFDYRAGKSTANDTLGMLKLFLRQLSMKIPDIAKRLEEQCTLRDELTRDRHETHIDVIADLIVGSGVKVCAFIDGLDEYEGDSWSLCSTLESLRSRTGIKMCLASRPEPAFEIAYSEFASITMQDIIEVASSKVAKFTTKHPTVHGLFPEELLDPVVDKAQGVILWARLVVEEMIKSCEEDTTRTDLYTLLDGLPTELGMLYKRILGNSNKKYQGQAALVLHILNEAGGSLTALVLYQAWNYLDVNISHTIKNTVEVDPKIYEVTIKTLLGNLIEFVQPEGDSLRINIIHKSLSAYLAQTRWIQMRLSSAFLRVYPNDFWPRFASDMVKQAGQDSAVDITSTVDKLHETVRAAAQRHEAWSIAYHCAKKRELWWLVEEGLYVAQNLWSVSQEWKPWGDLLLHIIGQWFDITASSSLNTSEFPDQAEDLALLHLVNCSSCDVKVGGGFWAWKRILRLHESRVLNLVLRLSHGASQSPINMLEEGRWEGLSIAVLEDLFDVALLSAMPQETRLAFLTFLGVKFAIYVDLRHLCSLEVTFYPDIKVLQHINVLQHQVNQRPPGILWTRAHDKDCPYHHHPTTVGALKHWVNTTSLFLSDQRAQLQLFLQMGLSLDEPLYGDEHTLLHDILKHILCCLWYDDATAMFVTAAEFGATPSLKGQAKNDLHTFARNRLKRAKLSRLKRFLGSNNDEYPPTPERIRVLEAFVKVLKQYSANGGRWPEDLRRVLGIPEAYMED